LNSARVPAVSSGAHEDYNRIKGLLLTVAEHLREAENDERDDRRPRADHEDLPAGRHLYFLRPLHEGENPD
jgi:hypothetical protein